MKVLVIPDVHLKSWMFDRAEEVLKKEHIDCEVCLMDLADDWGHDSDIEAYRETYDRAIAFARQHPMSLWCYGNHDVSYMWQLQESGYSRLCMPLVQTKLSVLKNICEDRLQFIHRIDNVLFMHAGLTEDFVDSYIISNDTDKVIDEINGMGPSEMWLDNSPIWHRPQYDGRPLFKSRELLQVVGHTPVKEAYAMDNIISCDTFARYQNGVVYGTDKFTVVDTVTWKFYEV